MNRHSIPSPTLSRTSTAIETRGRVKYVLGCIPARIAVAIVSPVLFLTSLAMFIVGIVVAKALRTQISSHDNSSLTYIFVVANLHNLQRLAALFQITNYTLVMIISILGSVTSKHSSISTSNIPMSDLLRVSGGPCASLNSSLAFSLVNCPLVSSQALWPCARFSKA
jgi:hypothetical protein